MDDPIPVSVRGSGCGKSYKFETIARNIGAGGLCAFAPRVMQKGEKVSLRIRFARPGSNPPQAPEMSMRGLVLRVEERPGGFSVFAVSFLLYQLL
jgi:hypothetical protein